MIIRDENSNDRRRDSATQPFLLEDGPEHRVSKRPSWLSGLLPRGLGARSWPSPSTGTSSSPHHRYRGVMGRLFRYPPPDMDPKRKETAWLDGMRGVAAFLVMIFHYDGGTLGMFHEAPYLAPELYQRGISAVDPAWQVHRLPVLRFFLTSGHCQVSIFFILSGFILAWAPLRTIRTSADNGRGLDGFAQGLGSLAFRRWFRLFLPCFIVASISMVGKYFGVLHMFVPLYSNFFMQIWDYIKACESFANPFQLARPGEDSTHKYNMVLWTIPLEWAGSLIVFVTLLGIARLRFRSRVLVVASISFYAACSAQWHFWLFTAGILLADYVREVDGFENVTAASFRSRLFWLAVLLLGLFLGGVPDKSDFYSRTGYAWVDRMTPSQYNDIEKGTRFWWSLGSILIATGAAHFQVVRRCLESRFPRYLGRISFMLYLIHNVSGEAIGGPLLGMTKKLLGHMMYSDLVKQEVLDVDGLVPTLLMYFSNMLILVPIAMVLATWLEVFVDAPSTQFARWLESLLL